VSDAGTTEDRGGPGTRVVVIVLIAALAIATLVGFLRDPGEPRRSGPAKIEVVRGTACALLAQAARALDAGDEDALAASVREASRVAERTLERSGQTFGIPERTAIQLWYDVGDGNDAAIASGLDRAARACSSLGAWPGTDEG
jgi:hypothetical protein